ncbi:DUF3800 domain-containing protein [Corynebacterium sp. SA-MJD20WY100]|uniref:DUF3800 domain-containing protein n=1 Tax=Corynebacterium sp. SA-MJD20WY100 TaxID=3142969 RepID=UPI00322207F7
MFKGRGRIWATEHDVAKYNSLRYRRAIGRRALKALAGTRARVLTVAVPKEKSKEAYGAFVAWVENWAESIGEYVIIFFDGLQPDFPISPGESGAEHWGTAIRQAAPYRAVHRQLPLHGRRVIEDVVMKDSKRNQLIQAADLAAYGAFHLISRDWPEWCPVLAIKPTTGPLMPIWRLSRCGGLTAKRESSFWMNELQELLRFVMNCRSSAGQDSRPSNAAGRTLAILVILRDKSPKLIVVVRNGIG